VTALGGSHGYKYEEEVAKEFRRNEAPKSSYLWLFQKRESSALLVPHKVDKACVLGIDGPGR
jgi:hypothetical protein